MDRIERGCYLFADSLHGSRFTQFGEEILEKNPSMKVYVMGSLPDHLRPHLNGIDVEVVGGEKGQREAMKAGFTEFRTRVLEHWLNHSLPASARKEKPEGAAQ